MPLLTNSCGEPKYYSSGLIQSRTDPRNVQTQYTYDHLQRLKTVTYSNDPASTPAASFTYDDPTVPLSIGRITAVANSNSSTNYLQYDAFGSILQSSQTTTGSGCPSNICAFTYTYNLTGALTSEQYPSGRMVTTAYDGANRPKQLTGLLNGTTTTYADTIQYYPHGAVQSYNFNKGQLSRNYSFNFARLQPTGIADTVAGQTSPLLNLQLFWGDNGTQTTNNNGVLRQEIATTGKGGNLTSPFTASETYAYDSVRRIKSVIDTVGSATPERDFQYDAAGNGNMWVSRNDGALPQYSYMPNGPSSISLVNNQLTGSSNAYDFAGNQTLLNNTLALTYDGENRLISAGPSSQAATFDYDASGARIRETSSTHLKTVYIYDAMGQLAAETPVPGANSPCLTCYLSSDHLGTTRMVTAQDTSLIARHDYLPFGDELDYGTGNRPTSLWGATDGVHQRYTGQEDDGNGLMFFQDRYYSGIQGRFNSPDPANFGADILSPESWNGYAYVMNSPVTDVDPDGLQTSVSVSSGGGGGGDAGALGLLGLVFPFLNYAISFDSGPPKGMTNAQQMQFQNAWNADTGSGEPWSLANIAVQVANDATVGSGKEGANTVIRLANTVNGPIDALLSHFTKFQLGQMPELEGTTPGQKSAMAGVFVLSFFTGVGEEETAARLPALIADAEKTYPKLAGKFQLHHITPKYLGGAKDGALVKIPAAYHQLITNQFRQLAPYGRTIRLTSESVMQIIKQVYSKYPIPW